MAALQALAVRYTDCVPCWINIVDVSHFTLLNTQRNDPHKEEEKCFS
jgi:hypothetical protein